MDRMSDIIIAKNIEGLKKGEDFDRDSSIPLVGTESNVVISIDRVYSAQEIFDYVEPLKKIREDIKLTVFAPPNILGYVGEMSSVWPWIQFGMYGWEGVPYECLAWTSNQAEYHIAKGLEMGYAPVFKPPFAMWDIETLIALQKLNVVLAHRVNQETQFPGLRSYPGPLTARDFSEKHLHVYAQVDAIKIHSGFTEHTLRHKYKEFWTVEEMAIETVKEQ